MVCESPSGAAIAIPIWMTDPSVCAALSVGPPVVSLSALRALRTFLDGLHPTAKCDKSSENTSPSQSSDAAEKPDKAETSRSVLIVSTHETILAHNVLPWKTTRRFSTSS